MLALLRKPSLAAVLLCAPLACSSEAANDDDGSTSSEDASSGDSGSEDTSDSGQNDSEKDTGLDSSGDGDGDGDGSGDGDGDVESNCAGELTPGEYNREVTVNGETRDYRLYIPEGYDATAETPLVFNYHGYGSTAGQQVFFANMNPFADEQGFMIAYPEGLVDSGGSQSHNAGPFCCGDHGFDDVAFARALVDDVKADACVDERRIFSTGMSNGGYMSYKLGCDAADLIAAIAPVTGALPSQAAACNPSRPVPLIAFNGTADNLVSYQSAELTIDFWTEQSGCAVDPASEEVFGSVTCETWSGCQDDSEVVFCTAEGMGHCWPGTEFCIDGPSTLDVSANEMMWEFFMAHPMPEGQ